MTAPIASVTDAGTVTCHTCGQPLARTVRQDATTCSPACRKALSRRRAREADDGYVVTEADREAIRRAAAAVPIPAAGILPPRVVRT